MGFSGYLSAPKALAAPKATDKATREKTDNFKLFSIFFLHDVTDSLTGFA